MFRKLIGCFSIHEKKVIAITIFFLISLSVFPTFFQYLKTPKDGVFTFYHNSIRDYPYYISVIRQGTDGKLFSSDQFTSENQTPGLIQEFYLVLGLLGRLLFLSPVQIYFLARILLGILYLVSGYFLIKLFFDTKNYRILAFLLFAFSSSFPNIVINEKGVSVFQFLNWWTEIDPLRRAAFIPHFLIGHIGLAFCVYFLIRLFKTSRQKYLFISSIIGAAAGLTHPPSLVMVYYTFGIFLFLKIAYFIFEKYIAKRSMRFSFLNPFYFSIFLLFTAPSLFYIYFTINHIFPWTLTKAGEVLFYHIDTFEYLLAVGPVFLLGTLGFFAIHRLYVKKEIKEYVWILFFWVTIDVIMIPLSKTIAFLPLPVKIPTISNIRFLSMAIQLPLSILSIYFFMFVKKRFGKKTLMFSLIVVGIITLLPYPESINRQINDFANIPNYLYPKKGIVSAFEMIDRSDNGKAVLARHDLSLLLPLFAKNTVFAGHAVYTYENDRKMALVDNFFLNRMSGSEALDFLKSGNIDYIIADGEKELNAVEKYKFLKALYTSSDNIKVYKFEY